MNEDVEHVRRARVSIQLISPASGEEAREREISSQHDQVSIQLISPASGEAKTSPYLI